MDDDEKSFFEEIEREAHIHEVNNEITLFQQTGDARFFWRAFLLIHESGGDFPRDYLEQIATWAKRLLSANSPAEVAAAMDLIGDDKKHIGPKHSEAYRRRWRLASEVQTVQRLYQVTLADAIRAVARNRGLTIAKVKGDYHKVFSAPLAKSKRLLSDSSGTDLASAMKGWR